MSGGSSPYGAGPVGGSDGDTACADLRFNAQVHSLGPGAISVAVGDVLSVELKDGPVVAVVDNAGVMVGAIVAHVGRLLDCIRSGVVYEAEVTVASGGDIQVEVRAA